MAAPSAGEITDVVELVSRTAREYLETLGERPVADQAAETWTGLFDTSLPEQGEGGLAALRELIEQGVSASVASAGPRFFHFVIGGTSPAALGADWLTTVLDQNAGAWVASPLAARLETVSLAWLQQLFGLPESWGGVFTTGATMANFAALAAARQWWGERHGVDASEHGLAGLPAVPVLSSGYIHPSAIKALGMLGIGRGSVQRFARDEVGRLDLAGLERALGKLDRPAILIANAGEVNAGDFDPIAAMADLAEEHDAWLHVDGAFGLFAALSPRTVHLVEGVERAHSVIADGHKWLNVPYDCGFAFVGDAGLLGKAFGAGAAYLPGPDEPRPNYMHLGPEMSRRARALPVWATLRAYGRQGYRSLVGRHLELAERLAGLVDEAPDLERLAEVSLNIVCFRFRPQEVEGEKLDGLNERLGEAILRDGRLFVGTTRYGGRVALRPAIVNWRTSEADVELLVEVVRELGAKLLL